MKTWTQTQQLANRYRYTTEKEGAEQIEILRWAGWSEKRLRKMVELSLHHDPLDFAYSDPGDDDL